LRAWIYDRAIKPLTWKWYREVLRRLDDGSRMLDVGIGTGGALSRNAETVREHDIRITGVDIDADYITQCRKTVKSVGLSEHVDVHLQSVYEFEQGGFDAAYFSASFMLMPDPAAALKHVMGLLRPGGRVFFTQTFEEKRSPLMEKAKPLLRRITTIDFGTVTYEHDFIELVESCGIEVVEHVKLTKGRSRTGRLVVGRPLTSGLG
jgi:ubiquinone/menaquinone biosynthesis C-methylase UbiE